jgi:hypothetical protein
MSKASVDSMNTENEKVCLMRIHRLKDDLTCQRLGLYCWLRKFQYVQDVDGGFEVVCDRYGIVESEARTFEEVCC